MTDLLVDDVEKAFEKLIQNGCKPLRKPFDIPVGKMAIVLDPWGNTLQFLDLSKREEFNKTL